MARSNIRISTAKEILLRENSFIFNYESQLLSGFLELLRPELGNSTRVKLVRPERRMTNRRRAVETIENIHHIGMSHQTSRSRLTVSSLEYI